MYLSYLIYLYSSVYVVQFNYEIMSLANTSIVIFSTFPMWLIYLYGSKCSCTPSDKRECCFLRKCSSCFILQTVCVTHPLSSLPLFILDFSLGRYECVKLMDWYFHVNRGENVDIFICLTKVDGQILLTFEGRKERLAGWTKFNF